MSVHLLPPHAAPRARVHHGCRPGGASPSRRAARDVLRAAAPTGRRALIHYQTASDDGAWSAPAVACDALGCEVEAPARLEVGEEVVVELEDERVGPPSFLVGEVRTCSDAPPWRLRIRFDALGMLTALRFF